MKLSEAVDEVIRLGEAIRIYWDRELPRRHPRYPIVEEGVDDGPPPPETAELEALLNRLTEEQVYTLLLLFAVGRREYKVDRLESAYQTVKDQAPTKDQAVAWMLEMGIYPDDLLDALDALEKRGMELDCLHFETPVAAG